MQGDSWSPACAADNALLGDVDKDVTPDRRDMDVSSGGAAVQAKEGGTPEPRVDAGEAAIRQFSSPRPLHKHPVPH